MGLDGRPEDSAYRPAMPYDALPRPRRALPFAPSGGESVGSHEVTPRGSRWAPPCLSGLLPPRQMREGGRAEMEKEERRGLELDLGQST